MALIGGLATVRYESDTGELHNAKVGQTTVQLNIGGTPQVQPTGAATTPEWVRAHKNQNEWGLEMREISYCYDPGDVPDGKVAGRRYKANILASSTFNNITIGSNATVDGSVATIIAKKSEVRTPES